jgi:hypothetical protein
LLEGREDEIMSLSFSLNVVIIMRISQKNIVIKLIKAKVEKEVVREIFLLSAASPRQ